MEDNKLLFTKKLEELVTNAKKKKNVLEYQEVMDAFSSMSLDADQSEQIFDYLENDSTVFEKEPMQRLAAEGELKSFYHSGFWQCMDTQREMNKLETLWQSGNAPWKIWKD